MSNMRYWDVLGKTDPKETKQFTRSGGFKGTAIKPMWANKRMTEQFGPAGSGWGSDRPEFHVVPAGDEIMVYCNVALWYKENDNTAPSYVHGVGGDKVVVKTKNGLQSDDEAFKKAYTDALSNAMKFIGVGADVHMGLFDDSKYVQEMREEFSEPKQGKEIQNSTPPPKTISKAQRDSFIKAVQYAEIDKDTVMAKLFEVGKFKSSGEITEDKYTELCNWVVGIEAKKHVTGT